MQRRIFLAAGCALAAGCGGGGGGQPAAAPSAAPAASEPAATASAPATAASAAPAAETGPRTDLPDALTGIALAHPLVVYGDSMAVRLAAALGRAVGSGVESHALGGSPSATTVQYAATYPAGEQTAVIWTGHNDFTDPAGVLANIARIVGGLGHARFVVLTLGFEDMPSQRIGGADRALKEQVNAAIVAAYPGQVIDAPELLAGYSNPKAPLDVAAIAAGLTPASLRDDALHISPLGADLLARQALLLARGAGW